MRSSSIAIVRLLQDIEGEAIEAGSEPVLERVWILRKQVKDKAPRADIILEKGLVHIRQTPLRLKMGMGE